ncbi:MAG: hypothetical protein QOD77_60 [Thermoplasmata archaeon]|jgi:hypothetical protein|nr:hypothetical protein [Thermoplasmata archaeon]
MRALVVAALLLAPVLPALASGGGCQESFHPAIGRMCARPDGLFDVLGPDGARIGVVHGLDPVPAGAQPSLPPPAGPYMADNVRQPSCVDMTRGVPGHVVIMAYVGQLPNAKSQIDVANSMRMLITAIDKVVDDSGLQRGDHADLRVACSQGQIAIFQESIGAVGGGYSGMFSHVKSSLMARGYNDPAKKYWVYYDALDPTYSAAGVGDLYYDDSPLASNLNNGNSGTPTYAVSLAYWDVRVLLHEAGHNQGAVQASAPHHNYGGHCDDGYDIMCYTASAAGCPYSYPDPDPFDCHNDDYFDTQPAPASYLATHWNLANPVNRYMHVGASTMDQVLCNPAGLHAAACVFYGGNPGVAAVEYRVDWGDGTIQTTTGPAPGVPWAPKQEAATAHAYLAGGTYTVHVSARDADGGWSGGMPYTVTVV